MQSLTFSSTHGFILWCLGIGDVFMSTINTIGRQKVLRCEDSSISECVVVRFYGMMS